MLQEALGGAYEIGDEIGAGMSRVFRARELALDRAVVVKVLAPERVGDLQHDRFRQEIQLLAALQHPHIVPLLVAGEVRGVPYYTMPFVEGETLRERLARGPLPLGEAFMVLRDVLKALSYAHARGVVHRDVKPENIMLSGGAAVVTDFGVAKALQASQAPEDGSPRTSRGFSVGTPLYTPPEQAAADPAIDHRADLYALAFVAYEMFTGAHPFAGRSGLALLSAHAQEMPAPLKEAVPAVPRGVASFVMQAMAKAPDDRPATADVALTTLEALVTPRVSTAISGPQERTSGFTGAFLASRDYVRIPRARLRLWVGIVAAALVTAAVLLWWKW